MSRQIAHARPPLPRTDWLLTASRPVGANTRTRPSKSLRSASLIAFPFQQRAGLTHVRGHAGKDAPKFLQGFAHRHTVLSQAKLPDGSLVRAASLLEDRNRLPH